MSYGDYLHLEQVLGAQHPLSPEHNEMLFIVQHQTSELWMKLLLHELAAAVKCVTQDQLGSAFKMLARVSKIMEQLVHAWGRAGHDDAARVLGDPPLPVQQQRLPELAVPTHRVHARTTRTPRCSSRTRTGPISWRWSKPPGANLSLYDESLRLLARRGLPVPASHTERDLDPRLREQRRSRTSLAAGLSQPRESTGTCISSAKN